MKTILIVLLLTLPTMAQDKFRSHDHEQSQHRKRGEPRRVVRTTPRITITGTDPRLYNKINDCANYWARDDAPLWVKKQAARDRRTCLREYRRNPNKIRQ